MISRSTRRRLAIAVGLVRTWRPTGARLVGLLRATITNFIALGVTLFVLPGRQSSGPGAVLLLVVTVAAVGVLLRPVLLGLTALLGSFGLLLVGFLAQAVVLAVAISLAPDVHVERFTTIVGAAWLAATIAAVVNWLLDAGSQDVYLAHVMGRVIRITHRRRLGGTSLTGEPGLLIVQLDGVGQALMRQAIVAGAVPTMSRWLREGTHREYRWHTGLPATTPAGQAVLLHGDTTRVPCFRWYDKSAGRVVVANRPSDAAAIEAELSDGRGLLADDGVSISNLLSGDAPTRLLTMSDAHLPSRTTRGVATFATTSLGFVRTLVVFAGQVLVELYQGRRQRRRDVHPRVDRGRVFALLRAVTAALLHDLNVALVAEQMARGAPVIFVDFLDFDELAHHAGPSRPESMRTLDGLDRVLGFFAEVAAETHRRYEIVVLSDHGQAQGEPFAQLTGRTLDEVVAALASEAPANPNTEPVEQWGPANLLLTGAARSRARALARLARHRAVAGEGEGEPTVTLGHDQARVPEAPVVMSAGSLAHVYLPDLPGRADHDRVEARHPGLIGGLASQRGIGAVLVHSPAGVPVVLGGAGWRELGPDGAAAGEGVDPLAAFGPDAARDLLDLDARDDVGDIVVLGRFDPDTGEVAAFEELVGSHGGLGGDQTAAILLVPDSWPRLRPSRTFSDGRSLSGLDVHEALLARLRELGLRPGDVRVEAERVDVPR